MSKRWKLLAITASVAVAGLAVVGGASAATDTDEAPAATDVATIQGSCGASTALADNPQALAEWEALRSAKLEAWQAWFAKYDSASERSSAAAQAEKAQLREQYRSDMSALFEKYGVEAPVGTGAGARDGAGKGLMRGGGMGGGFMRGASR